MRSKRGFTLVELLIVISIIAILIAILFPVFNRARKQAVQSDCQSNLRQLATALSMYTTDHDNVYPLAVDATWLDGPCWGDAIWSYAKNEDVYNCKAADVKAYRGVGGRFLRARDGWLQYGFCYGINACDPSTQFWGFAIPPNGGPTTIWVAFAYSKTIAGVEDPSGTILLADGYYHRTADIEPEAIWRNVGNDGDYSDWLFEQVDHYRHDSQGIIRRSGKLNAAFCDGHVKLVDVAMTMQAGAGINMWTTQSEKG